MKSEKKHSFYERHSKPMGRIGKMSVEQKKKKN